MTIRLTRKDTRHPMPQQIPQTVIRHGLIENAAGQLKCPLCRESLEAVLMVSTTTGRAQTMVLPQEVRVYDMPPQGQGIHGIVVGMSCKADHQVFLSLVAAEGYITVKTEWEEDDE